MKEALRTAIKKANLTPTQVARAIGVAPNTVFRWLSGDRAPTRENLFKLADVLGVSVDKLRGV